MKTVAWFLSPTQKLIKNLDLFITKSFGRMVGTHFVLSFMYALLANREVTLLGFAFTFFLGILVVMVLISTNKDEVCRHKVAWLLLYFTSPILFNGLSLALAWAGMRVAARIIFYGRYLLLILPIIGLGLYVIWSHLLGKERPETARNP